MISIKRILVPALLMLTLAACHESFAGQLYEYKIVCQGQSEPIVITDTRDQYVYYSLYSSGYLKVTLKDRHNNIELEVHEWPDQSFCSVHKKFLGMAEPVGNDG